MLIEDMTVEEIDNYLAKAKKDNDNKDWRDAVIEYLETGKYDEEYSYCNAVVIYDRLTDGEKTTNIIKFLNIYDGFFWFETRGEKPSFYIKIDEIYEITYTEAKRLLEGE